MGDDEDTVEGLQDALAEERKQHAADMEIVSTVLQEEAEERDWCDEYDDVITRINARVAVPLAHREYDRRIHVTGRVSYEFDQVVTIRVPARIGLNDDLVRSRTLERLQALGIGTVRPVAPVVWDVTSSRW